MPLYRDRSLPASEYKGRPTQCCDSLCPCRPCWNAHDCGYRNYGGWVTRMECATRYNNGCPSPKPEPSHQANKAGTRCIRCGAPNWWIAPDGGAYQTQALARKAGFKPAQLKREF
jgi:hypothetical protein